MDTCCFSFLSSPFFCCLSFFFLSSLFHWPYFLFPPFPLHFSHRDNNSHFLHRFFFSYMAFLRRLFLHLFSDREGGGGRRRREGMDGNTASFLENDCHWLLRGLKARRVVSSSPSSHHFTGLHAHCLRLLLLLWPIGDTLSHTVTEEASLTIHAHCHWSQGRGVSSWEAGTDTQSSGFFFSPSWISLSFSPLPPSTERHYPHRREGGTGSRLGWAWLAGQTTYFLSHMFLALDGLPHATPQRGHLPSGSLVHAHWVMKSFLLLQRLHTHSHCQVTVIEIWAAFPLSSFLPVASPSSFFPLFQEETAFPPITHIPRGAIIIIDIFLHVYISCWLFASCFNGQAEAYWAGWRFSSSHCCLRFPSE